MWVSRSSASRAYQDKNAIFLTNTFYFVTSYKFFFRCMKRFVYIFSQIYLKMCLTITFFCIFLLIVGVITLSWVFGTLTYDHWKKLGIIYVKPTPFFGNIWSLVLMKQAVQEIYDQLYKLIDKLPYGGHFEMRTPVLVIKDPALVQRILVTDFKYFTDRGLNINFMNMNKELNPLSENLFFLAGRRWKILKQKMSPMFTAAKLKGMQNQLLDCLSRLIDHTEIDMTDNRKEIELKSTLSQFVVDVIGPWAFGIECNAIQLKNKFQLFAAEILKPRPSMVANYFLGLINKKLLSVFQLTDFPSEHTEFFQNVVYNVMLYRRENNLRRDDLLHHLMDMQNEAVNSKFAMDFPKKNHLEDDYFDEVDVAAHAFLFFLAGFETSSSTLSYCLYELALNHEIQEKLRTEVLQVYQKNGNKIDCECLHDLTYMDAVISETLRKYPPVPVLHRQCSEDYVIPETGLKLQRGDLVHIPVWSLHHDWRYYPNPDLFDPERFNDGCKQPGPPGTYLPFGDGPRHCMGKRFARIVMKLTLSRMLIRFHLTPCSKTEMPLTYQKSFIVLLPQNGVWLNVKKREESYTI